MVKKIKKRSSLEKRLEKLEKEFRKKIENDKKMFEQMNTSFKLFKDVIEKMHRENEELKKDRDFLVEKHKELVRKIPTKRLEDEVKEMTKKYEDVKHEEIFDEKNKGKIIKVVDGKKKSLKHIIKPIKERVKNEIKENKEIIKEIISEPKKSVKTPIDELFELVLKKGKIRISEAARIFGVHELQIEEWAKILEEHGLIEIHYPAVGKPELRKKNYSEK